MSGASGRPTKRCHSPSPAGSDFISHFQQYTSRRPWRNGRFVCSASAVIGGETPGLRPRLDRGLPRTDQYETGTVRDLKLLPADRRLPLHAVLLGFIRSKHQGDSTRRSLAQTRHYRRTCSRFRDFFHDPGLSVCALCVLFAGGQCRKIQGVVVSVGDALEADRICLKRLGVHHGQRAGLLVQEVLHRLPRRSGLS